MTTLTNSSCDDYEPLLAAYALGEHDSDILHMAKEHIAQCAYCRKQLESYQMVAQLLSFGAPIASPPPQVRERVLAGLELIIKSQEQILCSKSYTSIHTIVEKDERSQQEKAILPQTYKTGTHIFSKQPHLILTFNTIALFLILSWNISLQYQQQALVTRQQQHWTHVIQLLNEPNLKQVMLTSVDVAIPTARGSFWFTPDQINSCIVVQGLPPLAPDRTYQLWLLHDNHYTSGGTFQVDQMGNGWLLIKHTVPLNIVHRIDVTIEPNMGSSQPTTPSLLSGNL